MSEPRYPRLVYVLALVAVIMAAAFCVAAWGGGGITIRLDERGAVISRSQPAPAPGGDMEREIEEASATVRDFAARHPLPR